MKVQKMTAIEIIRFEISQDKVRHKGPAELAMYIAGMSGTDEQLTQTIALVDVLKGYDKEDGSLFEKTFLETRAKYASSNTEF